MLPLGTLCCPGQRFTPNGGNGRGLSSTAGMPWHNHNQLGRSLPLRDTQGLGAHARGMLAPAASPKHGRAAAPISKGQDACCPVPTLAETQPDMAPITKRTKPVRGGGG